MPGERAHGKENNSCDSNQHWKRGKRLASAGRLHARISWDTSRVPRRLAAQTCTLA
jgi:hypothetical protein